MTQQAITALSDYIRLERPRPLEHDKVFVNLDRRGFGQPFRYRSWVAICEQARTVACTRRVHAHAFRHTFATNMADSGMPLDALQRALGHSNMDSVMIYNQVRDGRMYREYQEAMAVQNTARRLREQQHDGFVVITSDTARPLKLTTTDRRILSSSCGPPATRESPVTGPRGSVYASRLLGACRQDLTLRCSGSHQCASMARASTTAPMPDIHRP